MSEPTRLIDYINALDAHDWLFEFSDDQTVWHRGRTSLRKIQDQAKEVDPDFVIWNDRCPPDCRRKP